MEPTDLYKSLLSDLNVLILAGRDNTKRAEKIRESMDMLWYKLNAVQQQEILEIAAELSKNWPLE